MNSLDYSKDSADWVRGEIKITISYTYNYSNDEFHQLLSLYHNVEKMDSNCYYDLGGDTYRVADKYGDPIIISNHSGKISLRKYNIRTQNFEDILNAGNVIHTKFDIIDPPVENKKIDELTDEQIRIAYHEFGFDLPKTIKPTGLDYYKNSSERTGYTIIRLYFNDQSDVRPFLSSCEYVGKEYDAHGGGTKQCVVSINGESVWIWRSNNSIFLEKFGIFTQKFQDIINDKNVINKNCKW